MKQVTPQTRHGDESTLTFLGTALNMFTAQRVYLHEVTPLSAWFPKSNASNKFESRQTTSTIKLRSIVLIITAAAILPESARAILCIWNRSHRAEKVHDFRGVRQVCGAVTTEDNKDVICPTWVIVNVYYCKKCDRTWAQNAKQTATNLQCIHPNIKLDVPRESPSNDVTLPLFEMTPPN
ncbi:hypothetical protein PtB15_17B145 [Puccinia triticina]|nr:hypothetical protein PtB15_17B145 [Puccinia triticina]